GFRVNNRPVLLVEAGQPAGRVKKPSSGLRRVRRRWGGRSQVNVRVSGSSTQVRRLRRGFCVHGGRAAVFCRQEFPERTEALQIVQEQTPGGWRLRRTQ